VLEDLQSSRKRFDPENCEGDLCWSQSESEGKKELSVICIDVMVWETTGNEGTERSGVHDEE